MKAVYSFAILFFFAGKLFAQFSGGNGTAGNPYQVATLTDLNNIRNYTTRHFIQTSNIDASPTSEWNSDAGFTPIPNFTGTYNGNRHTISGLYINKTGSGEYDIGLFGYTYGATIKYLGLINANISGGAFVGALAGNATYSVIIKCYSTGSVRGDSKVGGLVGKLTDHGGNRSSMDSCYSAATITATNTGSYSSGDIGGLVGVGNNSTINECYSTGDVNNTNEGTYIGGFIGYVYGATVTKSYSTGNVNANSSQYVGGFAGNSYIISNSYCTGSVSGSYNVGGFVGRNINQVNNCYSTGSVSGSTNVGGFCGNNVSQINNCFWDTQTSGISTSSGGTIKTTAEMKTLSTFTNAGWDFSTPIWKIDAYNESYPYLAWMVFGPPTIQANNITFSSVTFSTMIVNWSKGNGSRRVVFVKQASYGTASPVDNAMYIASTTFGSGTQINSTGWYCVYNGTGSNVTITGLNHSTDYIVQVFEYNGSADTVLYLAMSATDNPKVQQTIALAAPTTQAQSITFSNAATTQMTIGWTNGNGEKRAVFVKQAGNGTASPVDNTHYTTNTTFRSGTEINSTGWYCVYNGTGTSVTVTGLSIATEYVAQVFEYNGTEGSEKYLTSTASDNPNSQTTLDYVHYALSFDGVDYAEVPFSSAMNPPTFTYELWARVEGGNGAYRAPFSNRYYDGSQARGITFYATDANTWSGQIGIGGGGWASINGSAVQVGIWTHLAMTYDGTTLKFYVNGTLQGSLTTGFIPNTANPLRFGCVGNELNFFFNGKVDEQRVWNVAHTAEQINSYKNNELRGNESGLVAYYKMSNGSGNSLTDNATGAYGGTLASSPQTPTWSLQAAPVSRYTLTTQAYSITFSSISTNQMTINWTNGDGENRAVFLKQSSSGTAIPSDNNTYTANTTFRSGTQIGGTGWYCIYNGTGTSATVTGLTLSTDYIAQVFEYNGMAGNEKYLTISASDNPKSQMTSAYNNYALKFDGSDDYVEIPYNATLNPTTFTYECWARVEGGTGTFRTPLASRYDGEYVKGLNFYVRGDNNKWSGFIGTGGSSGTWCIIDGSPVEEEKWTHLAMSYDGSIMKFYVNGILQDSRATNFAANTSNALRIGCLSGSPGLFFNGKVDEVRVWNVARTPIQIQSNMHHILSGSESGLVGYWQLDDGSGTTTNDLTTNGNNGTLNSFIFNAASGWVTSTAPIGMGTSSSVSSFTSGTATFSDISLTTTFANPVDLMCTSVPGLPNQLPGSYSSIAGNQYFILNVFGTPGTFSANLTFNFGAGVIDPRGDTNPQGILLYRRSSTSDGEWILVGSASSVNSAEGTVTFNNITSFSQFAVVQDDGLLPIELVLFTALSKQNNVELHWQTATEVNNYGFEIERLQDCKIERLQDSGDQLSEICNQWEKIGFVEGTGNSNSPNKYSFVDRNVASITPGNYFYRLKQIDNDGKFSYSNEVEVNIKSIPTEFSLEQNYPNPFNPTTKISWQSPVNSWQTLKVYDILGNEVATLVNEKKEAGFYEVQWNADNLASGIYFYTIYAKSEGVGKDFRAVKKMLMIK